MATILSTRRPTPRLGVEQALGWMVIGEGDDELIVHDGATLRYASSVAWDPKKRVGVVVLSNQVASEAHYERRSELMDFFFQLANAGNGHCTTAMLCSNALNALDSAAKLRTIIVPKLGCGSKQC